MSLVPYTKFTIVKLWEYFFMLDLSHKASHAFWQSYDPVLYQSIVLMEGAEDWTLDGEPVLEEALLVLAKVLDTVGSVELLEEQEKIFVDVIAQIKTARGLRLLMALDTATPGAASKVLMYAEQHVQEGGGFANLLLARNIVFERLRLLGRLFSVQRFKVVTQALESE